MAQDTNRKLADMTDEGVFERLATAILRISDDAYHSLNHPGVNADGKTVKGPLDGITYLRGAKPLHMIAVHHTIATSNLEGKWLHDPAKVKPRKKGKPPTAPPGDLIKTIAIVEEERKRTPDLKATLVLTTNQEPDQTVVRNVHALAASAAIVVDIWPRSRLAHSLDTEAQGQWLRHQFFGTEQVLLSEGLLGELSKRNLDAYRPPDDQDAWVDRDLDRVILEAKNEPVLFVIAASGAGKSVACYKRLMENVTAGGFGFVVTDETVASSISVDQAVEQTLLQFSPSLLAGCGSAALQLSNPQRRLLLVVEDINRSGRSIALTEKIARWSAAIAAKNPSFSWQLVCPLWPQVISALTDEVRGTISKRAVSGAAFRASEGASAVKRRWALTGGSLTQLEAERISEALGHDPLMIALHDPAKAPDPSQTIANFVDSALARVAATRAEFSASEYRAALLDLAKAMLFNRNLAPGWLELLAWPTLGSHVPALRHLVQQGEIVRLAGSATSESLNFRHDRVRLWSLARAANDLLLADEMPEGIAAEPYFAEIFGMVLLEQRDSTIAAMAILNPLALFCAVPHFKEQSNSAQKDILSAIESWQLKTAIDGRENRCLRWAALQALAEAEGSAVLGLVDQFKDDSWVAFRARYRNGDLMGGIWLCYELEPGLTIAGYAAYHEHVKSRCGSNLLNGLDALLRGNPLDEAVRIGSLRLAGHIGEPALADAIRACWAIDLSRDQHLEEYLWAGAQCVDGDARSLLGPVCDAWANLPDESADVSDPNGPSPRDSLAAHHIRWAFRERIPSAAVKYFIERAAQPELDWPILYMLHEVDQPDALEFIVRRLAATSERLEGTDGFSSFSMSALDVWKRQQREESRAMSEGSRTRLLGIWQDVLAAKHLRVQAFRLWASTHRSGDLDLLRVTQHSHVLADKILAARLQRRDPEAIPALIQKLTSVHSDHHYWWQFGRYVWSEALTQALNEALDRQSSGADMGEGRYVYGGILAEMIKRLPMNQAESILKKHWCQVSKFADYVACALYLATPDLLAHAADALKATNDPKQMLAFLSMQFGYRISDRPGITRPKQIEAILPYLDLLSESDIGRFWQACNEHGWYELRRSHLDPLLSPEARGWVYLDDGRVMGALDQMVAEDSHWVENWIDDFLHTGATVDKIMSLVAQWVGGKSDIASFELAGRFVLHIGERRHLCLLDATRVQPSELATKVVADTQYGVRRRTLRT